MAFLLKKNRSLVLIVLLQLLVIIIIILIIAIKIKLITIIISDTTLERADNVPTFMDCTLRLQRKISTITLGPNESMINFKWTKLYYSC